MAQRLAKVNPLTGLATSGETLFATHCAACHNLGGNGNAAGPDLASLGDKTPRALLTAILNPNKAVEDQFVIYAVTKREGAGLAGMITAESANSITLMDLTGQQRQLLRTNIATLSSLGRSLMPEGLELVLNDQDLADLVAHINSTGTPPKHQPGNTPAARQDRQRRGTAPDCSQRGDLRGYTFVRGTVRKSRFLAISQRQGGLDAQPESGRRVRGAFLLGTRRR